MKINNFIFFIAALFFLTGLSSAGTFIVGDGGSGWEGNITYDSNITLVQATGNVELQQLLDYTSYWRLDNNTTIDEDTSNENSLTKYNVTSTSNGKYSEGFIFDNGYIRQEGDFDQRFNVQELTWTMWINNTDINGGDASGRQVIIYDSNDVYFQLDDGVLGIYMYGISSPGTHSHPTSIIESEKTFIGFSYNGSVINNALKIYVGGAPYTVDVNGSVSFDSNPQHGNEAGLTRDFVGMMDEIHFYNYILTDSEINQTRDNYHKITGNFTSNYTSVLGENEELKTLSFNGFINSENIIDIYASTDNVTWILENSSHPSGISLDISGNEYKYGKWKINTTDASLTPVIYNITGTYGTIEDSVDIIITYQDRTNLSYNIIWNVSNITAGVQHWNVSWNATDDGNTYYFRYWNDTYIGINQIATANNETLWFNSSTLLPEGIYYLSETEEDSIETFIVPAAAFTAVIFAAVTFIRSFTNRRRRR